MANKLPSTFLFILAALVLVSNVPLGHAQIRVTITGQVYCTPTGNPAPGASVVSGVVVNATCLGSTNIARSGSATTNAAGAFNITLSNEISFLPLLTGRSLSSCTISIKLPVNLSSNCAVLPFQGVLTSVPQLDSIVVTPLVKIVLVQLSAGPYNFRA